VPAVRVGKGGGLMKEYLSWCFVLFNRALLNIALARFDDPLWRNADGEFIQHQLFSLSILGGAFRGIELTILSLNISVTWR
jgi:hypothetical protein